jgi:hypothetical protein
MKRTYVVGDFGSGRFLTKQLEHIILRIAVSAQPITNHQYDEITPYSLRAPEIFIGGPWNEKLDIWTFGCLVSRFRTFS